MTKQNAEENQYRCAFSLLFRHPKRMQKMQISRNSIPDTFTSESRGRVEPLPSAEPCLGHIYSTFCGHLNWRRVKQKI